MNLLERIKQVGKEGIEANCHGTALYLIGAIDKERSIYFGDYKNSLESYLAKLKQVTTPEIGDIVTFNSKILKMYCHTAVIIELEPKIIVFHRESKSGPAGKIKLEELKLKYSYAQVEFYRSNETF